MSCLAPQRYLIWMCTISSPPCHPQDPAACPGSVCCITDALAGPRCTENLDCCGSKTCDTATGICSTVL